MARSGGRLAEDGTIGISSGLSPVHLRRFLTGCGYTAPLLVEDYRFGDQCVPLAGFSHQPRDARSACISVARSDGDAKVAVAACRDLGAPIALVCHGADLEWWRQTATGPEHEQTINRADLTGFFRKRKAEFAPDRVYRAKTLGRLDRTHQLRFVDLGLMPLVEAEIGKRVADLVVRVVSDVQGTMRRSNGGARISRQVFQAVFWLLAGKILHDKSVEKFIRIDLTDATEVLTRVGRHYRADVSVLPPVTGRWKDALSRAAESIGKFANLRNVSTESLAYVYEAAFVDQHLRKELSTHSTPSYLVDYMLWQLAPWIEEIPESDRYVFEPACGHGAFLVGAMRMLRILGGQTDPQSQHEYFKRHLRGIDKDSFALEIARLALTLADIPNPNGWLLSEEDMYESDVLKRETAKAKILLANPPFEQFSDRERRKYSRAGFPVDHPKAIEMVARTLPHLREGAVFGIVVPRGFLHDRQSRDIRTALLAEFEFAEMCLFPDKVFEFADMETVVLLGRRRRSRGKRAATVRYRRVREKGWPNFLNSYAADWETVIPLSRFRACEKNSFLVPELDDTWRSLGGCPTLGSLADIAQGLFFKGKDLPEDAWTIHERPRRNDTRGFSSVPADLTIYGLPPEVGVNLHEAVIDRRMPGATPGVPQVLLNYGPVGRGPWRLKALIDAEGHVVTNRIITVRPIDSGLPLEFPWALLNSPVGNAYAYCHLGKRDILVGEMRKMPIPRADPGDVQRVVDAARSYLDTVRETDAFMRPEPDPAVVKQTLLRMDAEVLRLYDLSPRLERALLDLFAGEERKGVGCKLDGYFPADFKPYVPLHEYISDEYRRATAGEMRRRYQPVRSPATLAALERTAERFAQE